MIPDLQASILCDDVRQERSGKFILIGIFDVIGIRRLPSVHPRICVLNRWCSGNGTFAQRTRILKPDCESVLAEGRPVNVKLPDEFSTATSVEVFMNLKLDQDGMYWVEVLLEDDLKLRYPLRVNVVEQSPRHGTRNAGSE